MSGKRVSRPAVPFETSDRRELWTDNEKMILLAALKKYGHKDITNLKKMLPNKSVGSVKAMLRNIMTNAKRTIRFNTKPPIDEWIDHTMANSMDTLIARSMLYISMFEQHPSTVQSAGINFRAAYDFLHRMSLGHPPVELDRRTKRAIYNSICQMVHEVRPKYQINTLRNIHLRPAKRPVPSKVYGPTKKKAAVMRMSDFLGLRDINPFMVPVEEILYTQHDDCSTE